MFKLDFKKSEEAEMKLLTSVRSSKKQAREKENIYFCFIDYAKAFDCVDHKNYGIFLNRWQDQTTLPACWEICIQVKKQELERGMKLQTGSKSRKQCIKVIYLTLLI